MENHKSRIGKSQMRQYMGDLYENPMVVYREYIQNACDAIEDALEKKLIPNRKDSTIIVNIDSFNHIITIEDRGIGISQSNIAPFLVDVASSKKINRAGQYGIGRLNGANYCDEIIYETSAYGEAVKSTLIWDVKTAREICDNPDLDPTVEEIIDQVTHLKPTQQEDANSHYCKVTLTNVNNDVLLDQGEVIKYISQIVPVDYTTEFKDNLLKPSWDIDKNKGFKDRFEALWIYKISVNNIPVEKIYASEIEPFKFGSLNWFSLKDSKTQEEFAWGWYAMNEEVKQMNDIPVSFIRARHCNYQIGPNSLLANLYPTPVAQSYFVGEMHLSHPNIQPTGSRDGIKQNETKLAFEFAAKSFFKDLQALYNRGSKFRSDVVEKIAQSTIQIEELSHQLKDEEDQSEKVKIKEKIEKAKEEKDKATGKVKSFQDYFVKTDMWNVATDVLHSVNNSVVKPYNKKEKVQKNDWQIKELKIDMFKVDNKAETELEKPSTSTPQNKTQEQQGELTLFSNQEVQVVSSTSELDDYKILGAAERKLVKKFYSVINSIDLPPATKERIKRNLKKKILS